MVSLVSAVLAGLMTYCVYVMAWATTPIPLVIIFIVVWFIFWVLIRAWRVDTAGEIFDTFFFAFLFNGDD